MTRPMTDAEKQIQPLRPMVNHLVETIENKVTPDWRLAHIRGLALELQAALASVNLSGPPKPIIPVQAMEVKTSYISAGGFPTTQLGVRDDWDGKSEWPKS